MDSKLEQQQLRGRRERAQQLGICVRTFDELVATGEIKSIKIGSRRLTSDRAIAEFIAKKERASR
jgi:excisionase family DNA binding protein